MLILLVHFTGFADAAKKKKNIVPAQPRVYQDVPRPPESEDITSKQIDEVTGRKATFVEGGNINPTDYLRCVHHMSRIIDPVNRVFHNYGRVVKEPQRGAVEDKPINASEYVSPLPEWCRFEWIPRQSLLAGLDSVVFIGDSVLLRAFHDLFLVPNEIYFQKIVTIDEILNGTVMLRNGRIVKVYFVKNLFAATFAHTIARVMDPKNRYVTPNSLVVTTLGMHDARWLIFRQQPPFYRKSQLGVWGYAKRYWNKHAGMGLDGLNFELARFANKSTWTSTPNEDGISLHTNASTKTFSAPFIVFRDPIPPSCDHPKYANRKLITRCPDLLASAVLPWYRDTITAGAGVLMQIPIVSVDSTMPPCGLIDAGHLFRWCNEAELQMIIQAFRLGRRLGIRQGLSGPHIPLMRRFASSEWVSEANNVAVAPFTVDHLPVVGMATSRKAPRTSYFRVRFDGPSDAAPHWLPTNSRSTYKEGLDPLANVSMLGECCNSTVTIPLQHTGPLDALNRAFDDDSEEATNLYYHSIRLGIYMHASLANAPNSKSNVTLSKDSSLEPYTLAAFAEQRSLSRWGVYYERSVTEIVTESEEYVALPLNASDSDNLPPTPTYNEQLVSLVRSMVRLGNQGAELLDIQTPLNNNKGERNVIKDSKPNALQPPPEARLSLSVGSGDNGAIFFVVLISLALLTVLMLRKGVGSRHNSAASVH